ncbi:MAG TPA: hypothetical protein DEA08_12975, partial [Planctomycetes bacterium]|nr:hypothetical protein [Planctomycetota bacterium]
RLAEVWREPALTDQALAILALEGAEAVAATERLEQALNARFLNRSSAIKRAKRKLKGSK